MKTLYISILSIFFSSLVLAQSKSENKIFVGIGVQNGNANSGECYLGYMHKGKYLFQFGFSEVSRLKADEVPYNYRNGHFEILGGKSHTEPSVVGEKQEFMLGRNWYLTRNNTLNIHLNIGISYNKFHIPYNFKPIPPCDGLFCFIPGPNYSYDVKELKNYGLSINPKINLLLIKRIGLGIYVGSYMNFNSFKDIYSFQYGVTYNYSFKKDE